MKPAEMDKDALKKTPFFHLVDPNKLNGIEDYTAWLEAILHNSCSVWEEENGEQFLIEIRQLVQRVNGLKIEIYSNEHPPPHFHVKSAEINASFDIESCTLLEGTIDGRDIKKVEFWHKHSKSLLIEIWNSTRPTECVVGLYSGT
jgi:hypothetical protein